MYFFINIALVFDWATVNVASALQYSFLELKLIHLEYVNMKKDLDL